MNQKVWTAAEIEKMSPADQDALFKASIVRDLDAAPVDFVERVRSRIEQRIADTEHLDRS